MSNTKIKAAQFYGVIGNGTNGYFLVSDGNGGMSWVANIVNPTITNVDYPGTATAADPAGGESITLTGTGFKTGATVTIGGTAAPSVSYVSATQLTITTPAKTAGDYDIVVTNTDTGSATYINGISYNGIPAWTTAAGSLGTFASGATISTITLQASEPDAGTITFNITNGALPTGLSLTGANIDGTTSILNADTLYTFTVTATDDENQATPRTFTITVQKEFISSENFTINTYTGNGSTQSIEGKIGTAADFNGSSSKIVTSSKPDLTTCSISGWVKTTSTSQGALFGEGYSGSYWGNIQVYMQADGLVRLRWGNASTYDAGNTGTSPAVNDGSWHHIVATINNSEAKLYIDGSLNTTDTVSQNRGATTNNFEIGYLTGNGTPMNFLNGKIDQVRIFNKILSSSEVTTLAAESNTSTTKSTTDIFNDGSGVALYEFEKGANDTGVAIDSGQSASFRDISQNYIQLPSGIDTILNTKTFGLSLWVKAPNAATDAVFSTETTNSTFQIHANWGFAGAYALINGGGSDINLGPVDSNWHHIVVTSDGSSSYKGYFDKSYKGASTYRQTSNVGTFLGAHPAGGFNLLGEIDQVRIFNRQLSQSDIDALYNETAPTTVDYFGDGNGKALYTLNGTPDDESGNYDATWNGTAAYSDPALLTQYNGTPTNVNFLGMAFQPDLVWVKNRTGTANNHQLYDSVRDATVSNTRIFPNLNNAQSPDANGVTALNSNGFTLGNSTNVNDSSSTYVAWCWKAGGADSLNENGSINSQVSANQDAGFSIVKYTGTFTSSTVGHGLSSTPEMIIVKNTDAATNWWVWTKDIGGADKYLKLNGTDVVNTATSIWNNTLPTSTVFSVANDGGSNGSGNEIIAYCFHSVDGYQKIGSYTGNGSSNTITTGFQPRFVMIKSTTTSPTSWVMVDALRDNADEWLYANESSATYDDANTYTELNTNGFTVNNTASYVNASGHTYIYLAIA